MHEEHVTTLQRELRLFPTTNMVIASMVGTGIFTTSGLLMADLFNPLLLVILWVVGGIIALCGALCYGELGATYPEAGGEYIFLNHLYHPIYGFLAGWISLFVGFSAPIAAASLGCSEYLWEAFPALAAWGNPDLLKRVAAMAIIIGFTLLHLRGLKIGALVQNWLVVMKVLLIVALVMAGFMIGKGSLSHFSLGKAFTFDFAGLKTVGLSLMWIMFAYSGWNASAYLGSEIKDPERNLPRSLLIGTGMVMLLYLMLNLLYIYAATPAEMSGEIAIGGLAAGNLFGASMQRVISFLIAFALLSSISAFIILGPRIYYAMARRGHFFKMAGRVHPVFKAPSGSIILQCCIALLMVLSGTFDQILTYMGFALGIFPLFAIFGLFKLRRNGLSRAPMPLFPLVPIFYLTISSAILVLAYFERPIESSIALGTILTGIPVFYAFTRTRQGEQPAMAEQDAYETDKSEEPPA
ncbi:APC family permease [Candidatus Zixiibacteriota bacterium]